MKRCVFFVCSYFIIFLSSCSTKYVSPKFYDFHEATELIGKNVVYLLEEYLNEDMRLRMLLAERQDIISMEDLKPKTITHEQLDLRKTAIEYLVNYTELLFDIFKQDHDKAIDKSINETYTNLESISDNHGDFLTPEEIGWFTSIAGAFIEATTYKKKVSLVLEIMQRNQPMIEEVIRIIKSELEDTQEVLENIFTRQFEEEVVKWWPEKVSSRDTYAKKGYKIVAKKKELEIITRDLITAVDIIPKTHKELITNLKTHGNLYRALRELINFAYRIDWRYLNYSKKSAEEN